jgi:hypothetical protein
MAVTAELVSVACLQNICLAGSEVSKTVVERSFGIFMGQGVREESS